MRPQKWIVLTLAKLNGKYPDRPNSSKRWRRSSSMHHAGRSSLTLTKSPIQNIYIRRSEKMFGYDNDELWNTVIKTYPAVGILL